MRLVDLNFATTPFRNNTPYYLGYGLGALFIAAFSAYNGYALLTYSKNRATLESDYEQKKARIEALYEESGKLQERIAKQDMATLSERAAFTNKMLDSRRFSWTALLNNLEEVQPYPVRMLSLRPLISQKSIVIEARAVAKDLRAFWNFQQNLQNDVHFRRVYPGGYLKSEASEFIFNIAFNYFPDGAPPGMEGLSPEEVARQTIVDAPGADTPAPEEEPPPPPSAPKRPGPAKKATPPAGVSLQAPAPNPSPPGVGADALGGRGASGAGRGADPAPPPPAPVAGAVPSRGAVPAGPTAAAGQANVPRALLQQKLPAGAAVPLARGAQPKVEKPKEEPNPPPDDQKADDSDDDDDSSGDN